MLVFPITVCISDQNHGLLQVFNVTHCDCESQQDSQSQSLDEITNKIEEGANVQINVQTSELQLNTSVSFTSLTSLKISGKSNFTTIVCTVGAGIVLRDISDAITMHNLKLLSCGSHTITNNNSETQVLLSYIISALTIIHCSSVKLDQLYVTKSKGIGLAILDHQEGNVTIASSVFEHNEVQREYNDTTQLVTGGGVYIQMSYFPPIQNQPILFHFHNCTFENNTAHTTHRRYVYADAIRGLEHKGNGSGGGVNLILGPGLNNVGIYFEKCYFVANQAFYGSGLAVIILGDTERKTKSVKVEILNSTFHKNGGKLKDVSFGGGAYMVLDDSSSDHTHSIEDCHYVLNDVAFVENLGQNGGGVYFSRKQKLSDSNSMIFSSCTFKRNVAHIGSAIVLFSSSFDGHLMIPTFHNCQFVENKINNLQSIQCSYGKGTIYINECAVHFSGFNIIKNNLGSGIHIVSGVVDFQDSSVAFIDNTSLRGGALALIESSTMIVGPNNYEFINNSATYQGGAIYARSSDDIDFTTSRRGCFPQYGDVCMNDDIVPSLRQRANVTFIDNKAAQGQAVFTTSFRPCQTMNFEFVNISQMFSSQGIDITNISTLQPRLATEVAMLSTSKRNDLLRMIPGKRYYHQVIMTDDLNNSVNTSFRVAIE